MNGKTEIGALLTVGEAAKAIDVCVEAPGATVLAQLEHGDDRHVSHADVTDSDSRVSITAAACGFDGDAPPSLGDTPAVLQPKDGASIGALAAAEQAPQRPFGDDSRFAGPRRGRGHLIIGPVGAGKSTFATRLAAERAALRLTLDQWMTELFRPDRPPAGDIMTWYRERAGRCVERIASLTEDLVDIGVDAVLEVGLIQRAERAQFYRRCAAADVDLTIYVIDAARDVRRERVMDRNQSRGPTFSMPVPPDVFELASDLWEPPDAAECRGRDVRFVRTDG